MVYLKIIGWLYILHLVLFYGMNWAVPTYVWQALPLEIAGTISWFIIFVHFCYSLLTKKRILKS